MKIKDNKIPANNKNIAICFMVAHCFFMSLGTVLLKLMQFDYHITQIMFFYNLLLCVTLLCLSFFGRKSLRLSCANIKYNFLLKLTFDRWKKDNELASFLIFLWANIFNSSCKN